MAHFFTLQGWRDADQLAEQGQCLAGSDLGRGHVEHAPAGEQGRIALVAIRVEPGLDAVHRAVDLERDLLGREGEVEAPLAGRGEHKLAHMDYPGLAQLRLEFRLPAPASDGTRAHPQQAHRAALQALEFKLG